MNKVILIGRMTKDPELRATQSGINKATFTLAIDRPYLNQEGERDADFINCVAWRGQADNIAKYCSKGSQVAVEGRIQVRNYDAEDGTKRYVTEVIVENCTFLGSKSDNNQNESEKTEEAKPDPFEEFGDEIALSDDDLPF